MEQQSKKTMRHFYCRDVLWETFEQMANDFDCSIDYLINESMRTYAKSKNYASPSSSSSSSPQISAAATAAPNQGQREPAQEGDKRATSLPPIPPPRPTNAVPMAASATGAPASTRPPTGPPGPPPRPPTRPPTAAPPRVTPPPAAEASSTQQALLLVLRFNNQRYPISKDQFVIGRGSKTSDLSIKDGNISRRHCAVIRRNGSFYIKDLGSTNGIDYKGMRIDNKRIDDGDVFHLCDYELSFSYEDAQ